MTSSPDGIRRWTGFADTVPASTTMFTFHANLIRNHEKVGHSGGVCTVTSLVEGATGEFQCQATYWLEQGQITVQGLLQPTGEFPDVFVIPITGGSGAFQGASGVVRETQESETRSVLRIRLEG